MVRNILRQMFMQFCWTFWEQCDGKSNILRRPVVVDF